MPAPRHTLDDEIEEAPPSPIPTISIQLNQDVKSIEYIIISPNTLKVLVESLPHGKRVGLVTIDYPQFQEMQTNDEKDDEYDEDEQLYSAVMKKSMIDKYGKLEIAIMQHGDSYLSINIPYFPNIIVNNILTSRLIEELNDKVSTAWITLSPALISSNETINKLEIDNEMKMPDIYSEIPSLSPPHFITGIGASFSSQISLLRKPKLMSIILRSEGQSGFEKIDTDSFVDACFILSELLVNSTERQNYSKRVSLAVRKVNGYANSGMFI